MSTSSVIIERDVEMSTRDGVTLRSDVWRIDDGKSHPTVLWRTPYNRKRISTEYLSPVFATEAGYNCVFQDTRGRFGSEGKWDVMMWDQEALDTFDAVEWIAAQPWCDGHVVMSGSSYLGHVQWLGAAQRPPHLTAIAPVVASTNTEFDRVHSGGTQRLVGFTAWLTMVGLDWVIEEIKAGRLEQSALRPFMELGANPMPAVEFLPLSKIPHFDIPGFPLDLKEVFASNMNTIGEALAEEIGVPSLSITGWYEVLAGQTIDNFVRMREAGAGGTHVRNAHRIIIGPWTHYGHMAHAGEIPMGLAATSQFAIFASQKHITFFDHHVRGADADLPAVEYFLIGAGWRTADTWPPPGTVEQQWFLSSDGDANTAAGDGRLSTQHLQSATRDKFDYDPLNPVRTIGGRNLPNFGPVLAGPFDQSRNEARADVCCYTSSEFETAIDAVGPVAVELWTATDVRDTDFVASICNVFPDGRSILVASGLLRARFRNGLDCEEFLTPGKVERYLINLGHIGWRFDRGHRLRLNITSSDFPGFDRNMNTGNPTGADAKGPVAHQEIVHDEAHRSNLKLTVLA